MARQPQELESYTSDELTAFASRLEKLSQVLRQLTELMKSKDAEEVFATYPRRVREAMDGVRSMESSFSKSYDALLAGKPLTSTSVSPRSVRRTESVKADVKKKLAKSRSTKKKG